MKRTEVVARARSATKVGIGYLLGAGGKRPLADHPGEGAGPGKLFADCSGMACWAFGIARQSKTPYHVNRSTGGWLNTDAIAADGRDPGGIFDLVPDGQAQPGDAIVFGSNPPALRYGHIGIVTAVRAGRPTRVVHCSPRNGTNAIAETDPSVFWQHGAIVVRFIGLEVEPAAPAILHPGNALVRVYSGRMSTFGGPVDGPRSGNARADWMREDLAILTRADLHDPRFRELWIDQPAGTTGLARRLNPRAFYVACRWDYKVTPKAYLRTIRARVRNPNRPELPALEATIADWGPANDTGRAIDLSNGLADQLCLQTDDVCEVILTLPLAA